MKHPTYIINLADRKDRRIHMESVFKHRSEFQLFFFDAIRQTPGSLGLFLSFKSIVQYAQQSGLEYVIICEDDHNFTGQYTPEYLNKIITKGIAHGFDIIVGGMSNVHDVLFLEDDLIWLSGFTGLQFTIVFSGFYQQILNYSLPYGANFDLELGQLSNNIYGCYPPISEQISFGYSDVTEKNTNYKVENYFENCIAKLNRLYKVSQYFDPVNR